MARFEKGDDYQNDADEMTYGITDTQPDMAQPSLFKDDLHVNAIEVHGNEALRDILLAWLNLNPDLDKDTDADA